MTDDKGRRVKSAGPSTPVEILGLSEVPAAGDSFYVAANEKQARQLAESVLSDSIRQRLGQKIEWNGHGAFIINDNKTNLNADVSSAPYAVNRKENGENAAWFLEQFPFEAVSLDELLPDELKSGETAKGQLQLIPGVHKTDGFFLAKFRKTEEGRA
jgi:hypothetical protein